MSQINIWGGTDYVPKAELDQYFTDLRVVRAHLRHVVGFGSQTYSPRFLELGAGMGAYIEGIYEMFPKARVTAVEADPELVRRLTRRFPQAAIIEGDLRNIDEGIAVSGGGTFDYCIGNPPYKNGLAEAAVRAGLKHAKVTSLLLRVNFMTSMERLPLWRVAKIKDLGILVPRPPFESEQGDGAKSDFALYGLARREGTSLSNVAQLHWVQWKERR
jgi:predicted RNA methylase